MEFKNLEISEFIRYVLTGFNFVLFVIVLPATYLTPSLTKDLLSSSPFFAVILLSVAIGYLLDILKIYQMAPKFASKRLEFMDAIAETLGVPRHHASNYFSLASKLMRKSGMFSVDRDRAEWVLMLNTGITLIFSSVAWLLISIYQLFQPAKTLRAVIPAFAIAISLICAIRLFRVANREREKGNLGFLIILEKNKSLILDSWKLTPLAIEDKKIVKEVADQGTQESLPVQKIAI